MSILAFIQVLPGILALMFIWHLWIKHKKLAKHHPEMTTDMWIEFYKNKRT